jgi:hypothetical protein
MYNDLNWDICCSVAPAAVAGLFIMDTYRTTSSVQLKGLCSETWGVGAKNLLINIVQPNPIHYNFFPILCEVDPPPNPFFGGMSKIGDYDRLKLNFAN